MKKKIIRFFWPVKQNAGTVYILVLAGEKHLFLLLDVEGLLLYLRLAPDMFYSCKVKANGQGIFRLQKETNVRQITGTCYFAGQFSRKVAAICLTFLTVVLL